MAHETFCEGCGVPLTAQQALTHDERVHPEAYSNPTGKNQYSRGLGIAAAKAKHSNSKQPSVKKPKAKQPSVAELMRGVNVGGRVYDPKTRTMKKM